MDDTEEIDYSLPTPETESFMTRIDGEEIDLGMLRAVLHDMEIQRDYWKSKAFDVSGMYETVIENQICELGLTNIDKHEAEACVLAWLLKSKLYLMSEKSTKHHEFYKKTIEHEASVISSYVSRIKTF